VRHSVLFWHLLTLIFVGQLQGQSNDVTVAVMDLDAIEISRFAAEATSNFISEELTTYSDLTIVERSNIEIAIAEQELLLSGFVSDSNAIQIGNLLAARLIVFGEIQQVGNVSRISVRVIDAETGQISFAVSESFIGEENLELAARIVAVKIGNSISQSEKEIPVRTYQQDEGRNQYSIAASPYVGAMTSYAYPILRGTYDSSGGSGLIGISSEEFAMSPLSFGASLRFDYEATRNRSFGITVQYSQHAKLDLETAENVFYSIDPFDSTEVTTYRLDNWQPQSLSVSPYMAFIYPLNGFNIFLKPGVNLTFIKNISSNSALFRYFPLGGEDVTGSETNEEAYMSEGIAVFGIEYALKSQGINTFLGIDLSTGFDVFISRFFELGIEIGTRIPILNLTNETFRLEFIRDSENNSFPSQTADAIQLVESFNYTLKNDQGLFQPVFYILINSKFRIF
jgi:TolB-like protein